MTATVRDGVAQGEHGNHLADIGFGDTGLGGDVGNQTRDDECIQAQREGAQRKQQNLAHQFSWGSMVEPARSDPAASVAQ